jgi:L-asparagine oxygenase
VTVATFEFENDRRNIGGAFFAQTLGTDPYTPGRRSRLLLSEILGWGLDLKAVADAVEHQGVALLRGLPVDPYIPKTPVDGKRSIGKTTYVSEGLLNAVSFVLGMHPVAMHNEKDGELIHQIASQPGQELSTSNAGADVFPMHTEGTHMDMPPNILALVCVRNTEMGATNFVALDEALRTLRDEYRAILRQPRFTQAMGISSGGGGRYPLAIINGPEERPIYRVDFTDVVATDKEAQYALSLFKLRAQMAEYRVALQPGEMVILNNHASLHGRVGFTPDYSNGEHRWLQRQYMTRHPWAGKPADDRYPHVWHGG